jgi:hypothetical protein
MIRLLLVLSLLTIWSCSAKKSTQSNANNAPATTSRATETPKPATTEPAKPAAEAGELKVGEASGSFTVKGETITLKYAYAGRAERFGSEAVVILLTDQEIPAAALAEEIKDQTMLLDGKIHGLEYAIMKDGYWVRYHPGQYQESKGPTLKDYVVENDVVKGSDEEKSELSDGKYTRSVKFVAAISK